VKFKILAYIKEHKQVGGVWWVPAQQLSTHKPLVHSHPPQRVKEENQRAQAKNLMGQGKDSSTSEGKEKKGGSSNAKAITCYLPTSRPASSQSPSNSYFPPTHTIYY